MTMPLSLVGFGLCAALTAPQTSSSGPSLTSPAVTGVFSNLRYNEHGADILGVEVLITYTRTGYVAVVQIAEGVPEVPVVVPVHIEGSQVVFSFPAGGATLQFQGSVGTAALEGGFSNGAFADSPRGLVILRRGKSYWQ